MKTKKHPSKISTVVPIRLSNEQLVSLRTLPPEVSISAIARALFQAYLEGSLPQRVYENVEEEARRTREAVRSGQEKLREKRGQNGKQQRQGRSAEQSLRESLLLRFRELREEGDAA